LSLGFRVYFISVGCFLVDGLELVFLHHPPSLVSFSEFYSRNMCTLLHLNVFPGIPIQQNKWKMPYSYENAVP
jgi:hypothetical protein